MNKTTTMNRRWRSLGFKKTCMLLCLIGLTMPLSTKAEKLETTGIEQSKTTVTGAVNDSYGESLMGVTVSVEGTTVGTLTDIDGKYSISVPNQNSTLVFSFIGFITQKVKVGTQAAIDIRLEEDAKNLEEVVVTALGMKREMKTLGYSMSSIKGEDITKSGVTTNPLSSLYGKAAGVGLVASSAGPTGGINIKIRGSSRLESSSSTRPLFVVDGVPIYDTESSMAVRGYDPFNSFDYGSGINDINPEDIESMEILKGAKASVLYGSAGANGVVLITTKKGSGTRGLGVTLSYNQTWEEPVSFLDLQNQYGSGTDAYSLIDNKNKLVASNYNFGAKFDGSDIEYWDGSTRPYQAYKNNYDDIFSTGGTRSVQAAVSGGNEKGNMRLSYTNYKFDGIVPEHWQKKHSFSFAGRMDVSPLAQLEVNTNLYKIQTNNRYPNISGLMSTGISRDYDYQTIASKYIDADGYKAELEDYNLPGFQTRLANTLWHQNKNRNLDDKTHLIASAKGTFKVHSNISIVTLAGIDFTQTDYTKKESVTAIKPQVKGGAYRFETTQNTVSTLQGMINYDKSFINDDLRVFVMGGGEYKNMKDYDINVKTYGDFTYPDWYSLGNAESWPAANAKDKVRGHGRSQESIYSTLGSATLSWKDRYHLEIQARNDWASTLPKGNNSYFYPGISFNWNFHEDISIPELQSSNLRLGWADVGRPATRYFALRSYEVGSIAGTEAQTVTPPKELFAGALKPERKREFEVGLNTRWFKDHRLEVDISYYTGKTYDQIMGVPLSPATGYEKIRINAGEVTNSGYEILIKGAILQHRDYRWEATVTLANQFSKVNKLYPGITRNVLDSSNGWQVVATEGERSGEIMTYDYNKTEDGQRIVGDNGLYSMDKSEFVKVGNVNPSLIGGFATDFFYKNFNIHLGFDYSFGSRLISMSNYYLLGTGASKETLAGRDEASGGLAYYYDDKKALVPWEHGKATPSGERLYHDGIVLPGVKEVNGEYVKNDQIVPVATYWQTFIHDMQDDLQPDYIYKNNYIKMREIALSYTIPKKVTERFNLQKVTLSLTGRNLFYLHKSIKNIDSESVQGTNAFTEYSIFPMHRSWGFGVNVSF